jgi:perosamine synthetase
MEAIRAVAADFHLEIVDDAAHAFPASWQGRSVGGFGCPTAFSFYATKTLTTAEGGMLTTEDDAVAARARLMALHGISRDAWKRYTADGNWQYEVLEAGYKYNLTDIAAALGRVQLSRALEMRARRAVIASRYNAGFKALEHLESPSVRPGHDPAWHLYPIRLNLAALAIDRSAFIDELRHRGIGASVHFIPLHQQRFYRLKYDYAPSGFPVAETEFPRLVSLPIYSRLSDADADRVIEAVVEIATTFSR